MDYKFVLVLGCCEWGKGRDQEDALRIMREAKKERWSESRINWKN